MHNTVSTDRPEADIYPAGAPRAWFAVAVFFVVYSLSYLDRSIMTLLVEPIKAGLGISDTQIGILQGVAFGVFYAAFGLPLGWLVDRYSRRGVVFGGMTLWSLAATGCGLASNYWQLLVARFGVGMGEASVNPAAYSLFADLFPKRRLSLALGIFGAGSAIGSAMAYMGGGYLIEALEKAGSITVPVFGSLDPWQQVFILTGLPGVAVAMLLWLVHDPRKPGTKAAPRPKVEGMWAYMVQHKRYYLGHFIGCGIFAAVAYTAAWLPTLMVRRFEMPISSVGLILGIASVLVSVPGFLFTGWLADRWFASGRRDAHLRYFVLTGPLLALVGAAGFHFAPNVGVVMITIVIINFLQPMTGPAVAQLQMATPPEFRGRISAIYGLFFNLMGMCLGPPSVALLTDFFFRDTNRINDSLALVYLVGNLLGAFVLWLTLKPSRAILAERGVA
jgi:Arabinose efflux permease